MPFKGDNSSFSDLSYVLPSTAEVVSVNGSGHLHIGGLDVCDLAETYGTPLLVVDKKSVESNLTAYYEGLKRHFSKSRVCYAFKAFTCFEMARMVRDHDCWLLAASGEEIEYSLAAGFPADRIVFHGCNKSEAELTLALDRHIGRLVIDSGQEVKKIDSLAKAFGKELDVLLRVRPGIVADTHAYIQTAAEDSKFGTSVCSGESLEAIKMILASDSLNLKGFQFHIGSQIFNVECFEKAIEIMVEFAAQVKAETGFVAEEFDCGGGIGIAYTETDRPTAITEFCDRLASKINESCTRHRIEVPLVAVEPGRSIAGNSCVTLYRAGVIKHVDGVRDYLNVDGGMADNIRPLLYGASYEALNANKADLPRSEKVTLVGRYCEGDEIIESASIQPTETGDIVAVLATGAYCFSMSMNYNMALRPSVVFVKDGNCKLTVRRQTMSDLIACEVDSI